jgi:hypothetical protein
MEPSVKSLTEMIGDLIVARIPVLDKENKIVVRLRKVEQSGIWVESQAFNESTLEEYGMPVSVTSLLLFIPFSGIDYILSSIETIARSETAFGLDN